MKNNYFTKKPKRFFIAFLVLFCGLFANVAMAQATYTWNGTVNGTGNWTDTANWSTSPSTPGTFPGNNVADIVIISNGANVTLSSGTRTIGRITISNATGAITGSTLTISSGATLTASTGGTNVPVTLNGGNIVNNGVLNVTQIATTGTTQGLICGDPANPPTSGSNNYGYTGSASSDLNVSIASNNGNAAGIQINSTNTFSSYNFVLNGSGNSINFSHASNNQSFAIRAPTSASPVTISGTGFSTNRALLLMSPGTNVTVESGTTLTSNFPYLIQHAIILQSTGTSVTTTFLNKGTISIKGPGTAHGIQMVVATTNTLNFENRGTINVEVSTDATRGALGIQNSGTVSRGTVNITNTATGIMNLKNTRPNNGANVGSAFFVITNAGTPTVTFTNDGSLILSGTSGSFGGQAATSIINNGSITSNNDLNTMTITNNGAISYNFTGSTALFTVPAAVAGSFGTTYLDVNNNVYTVGINKVTLVGTSLNTTVNPIAAIPASGTLTKTGAGAGDATISFSAVAYTNLPNAMLATTTNNGVINTGTGSTNLNVISGVTTSSTSEIAPGGSTGKGIASFSAATYTILGTLKMQVAGNTTAGTDYDQVNNVLTNGGFAIGSGAILDVTGISGTATPVDIIAANGTGTITGTFASVIGLTTGWSVNYGAAGKVQLVYTGTTWNGSAWSNGTPDDTKDAIINGTYTTADHGTINAKSLTVNATRALTINSGTNVTVQNAVTNNGTLTIQNNANLIQVNNVTNSGSVTVNRNGSTLKRLDYTLWSSPVAPNQTLLNFSDLTVTPRFYHYNESSNQYNAVVPSATTFATGKGYLIRMPDQYPANSGNGTSYYAGGTTLAYPGVFTGILNNGDIPVTLTKSEGLNKGYQAVGNPYPSVIDATTFINANSTNIENTLYFWRKTNGASGSSYATWTLGGATSVTPSSETPNGKIQVGQGFFVRAKNAVTVSNFFTNAMRDVAPSSTQFFKTKQQAQKDRVWLNLTTTTGVFSQALVAYIDDATLGLDQYDGKYINDSGIALTTSIAGDEYTIQGRPAFDATDVVALNFKTSAAGTYSIAIDHVDGLFSKGQDIYLVDKTTGTTTNLNEGAYTFTAAVGVDNTRFTLTYQKTLKVDAPLFNENSVLVSRNNGTLNVKSTAVAINNVKVYDVQGRLVAERKNVKSNTATISNLKSNQVLIVKVTSENNAVVTKKVLN